VIDHDFNTLWDGTAVSLTSREPLPLGTVAGALARLARWNGQSILGHGYSVLHHSFVVCDVLAKGGKASPEALMLALWHDAHEIATADIPSPWKTPDMRDVQRLLDHHLYQYTLKLPFPGQPVQDLVRAADHAVLVAEARVLMPRAAQYVFDDEDVDVSVESIVRQVARLPREVMASMWVTDVLRLQQIPAIKQLMARAS
jgi:hypothetical protein